MAITNKGVIYPTSSDNIAPLETHFANLAYSADNAGIYCGTTTFTGPATTGATVDVTVIFPAYGTPPKVVAGVQGGSSSSVYAVTILGPVATGSFTARIIRLNGSTAETDLKLVWMLSTFTAI